MAKRQGIMAHPENYYRKMFEVIPGDILKLYVAEYENKIIAANLVVFYGETCTYLHGASDDAFRNVMAPYLLQWLQIQDAKKAGCVRYDFGGVSGIISNFKPCLPAGRFPIPSQIQSSNDQNTKQDILNTQPSLKLRRGDAKYQIRDTKWGGITKFKFGFAPKTSPTVSPGSYDIIIRPKNYWFYRSMQKIKNLL
jgi:lipid II:glycine glycyltransferase (peptidoglycan interpeptide bridge formation enzyme)